MVCVEGPSTSPDVKKIALARNAWVTSSEKPRHGPRLVVPSRFFAIRKY